MCVLPTGLAFSIAGPLGEVPMKALMIPLAAIILVSGHMASSSASQIKEDDLVPIISKHNVTQAQNEHWSVVVWSSATVTMSGNPIAFGVRLVNREKDSPTPPATKVKFTLVEKANKKTVWEVTLTPELLRTAIKGGYVEIAYDKNAIDSTSTKITGDARTWEMIATDPLGMDYSKKNGRSLPRGEYLVTVEIVIGEMEPIVLRDLALTIRETRDPAEK
jgi:hypothetical protein